MAAAAGTGEIGTWTSLDGPPVSTGTPSRFCQVEDGPCTEANTAYDDVGTIAEES